MFSKTHFAKMLVLVLVGMLLIPQSVTMAGAGGDAVVTPSLITTTLNAGQTYNAQIQVAIGEAPVGKGDVMFVIDRTSSMGDEIDQVKTSAVQIMNDIRSQLPFAWFGVGSFMDYPGYFSYPGYEDQYGSAAYGDVPWELNISLTDNIADVANTINGLWLGEGADWARVIYQGFVRSKSNRDRGVEDRSQTCDRSVWRRTDSRSSVRWLQLWWRPWT